MTDKKEIIAVTGATGNIGKYVVEGLIAKGFAPRAIVRKRESNKTWEKFSIEQVEADLNDVESLAKAFDGAGKVFSLSPLVTNMIELGTKTVKAAKLAKVKQIVRSSALGANVNAPIMMGKWHGEIEKMIEDSGIAFTMVQPASFFQNYLSFAETIKSQNVFYLPLGEGKISLVDTRDIADVAVAALTESGHENKKYAVTGGESLSCQDIAEIFSEVLNREIKYVDAPEDVARTQMIDSKMPELLVDAVMELNQIGKAGYVSDIFPTIEEVTGQKPRTFRQFVEENRAIFQ
jgi:uncharacterized protein YbjT (DUF2867 family)